MKGTYRSKVFGIIGLVVVLVVSIGLWTGYNGLVRRDTDVDLKFATIKSKLQLRHDALTQMIGAITGLEDYATEVWNAITTARTTYNNVKESNDVGVINEADVAVTDALYDLLVVVEDNRPVGVNVDSAYLGYMDSVLSMEYQLDRARQYYNEAVTSFNLGIRLFPGVLYAKLFGYTQRKSLWEVSENADDIPSFGSN